VMVDIGCTLWDNLFVKSWFSCYK